jgi:putative lipoic acid-binding regulatory protein
VTAHKPKDYTPLKLLLEKQETFPIHFTYKFIGRNSSAFLDGVEALKKTHPGLKHEMTRKSAKDAHISLTYGFDAESADAIIEIFRAVEKVPDLLIIL